MVSRRRRLAALSLGSPGAVRSGPSTVSTRPSAPAILHQVARLLKRFCNFGEAEAEVRFGSKLLCLCSCSGAFLVVPDRLVVENGGPRACYWQQGPLNETKDTARERTAWSAGVCLKLGCRVLLVRTMRRATPNRVAPLASPPLIDPNHDGAGPADLVPGFASWENVSTLRFETPKLQAPRENTT